ALAVAAAASVLFVILYLSVGRTPDASKSAASGQPSAAENNTSKSGAASAPIVQAPTTPASAAPGQVTVTITGKPKDPTIHLDGKALEDKPLLPKAGAKHTPRIEAAGYAPRTRDYVASDDLNWEFELSPTPHGAPPPHQPGTPPVDDPGKMVVSPTSRPID